MTIPDRNSPNRTVGIIGGKGPAATVMLFRHIVENTNAATEEEHLHIIIDNFPQIPKPALGITGQGPDPAPALIAAAQNLENAKADFIIIACNSAHYYLDEIRHAVNIPVLSIITETVAALKKEGCRMIGLLATTGLLQSRLYQNALEKEGIQVLEPHKEEQRQLMDGILDFKNKGRREELRTIVQRVINNLADRHVDGIAVACTDIPVVLQTEHVSIRSFDTTRILALAAIREARQQHTTLRSARPL